MQTGTPATFETLKKTYRNMRLPTRRKQKRNNFCSEDAPQFALRGGVPAVQSTQNGDYLIAEPREVSPAPLTSSLENKWSVRLSVCFAGMRCRSKTCTPAGISSCTTNISNLALPL